MAAGLADEDKIVRRREQLTLTEAGERLRDHVDHRHRAAGVVLRSPELAVGVARPDADRLEAEVDTLQAVLLAQMPHT